MLSSEVNSLDFICLFSSVWLIKLICVSLGCITTIGSKKPTVSSFEYRPYTDYKKFESCVVAIHGTIYIGIYGYVGGSYKLLGGRKSNCVNP
jgi:hypothetical protein